MKGIALMLDPKWKIVGIIISLISLMLMITEKLNGFILFKKFNAIQHYAIFEWILLLGLVTIIYSNEKYDDERAKIIRLKSFQIAFLILAGLLMNLGVLGILFPIKVLPIYPETLLMICTIGIVLYLFIFHIGLYFDFIWEYDDTWSWEKFRNVEKYKWAMTSYLLIITITIIILFIV